MAAVFDIYLGRGSSAHRPDLLLKLAIYEHCRGRTKPIQWHRDLKEDNTVQWLVFGLQVGWSQQALPVSRSTRTIARRMAQADCAICRDGKTGRREPGIN